MSPNTRPERTSILIPLILLAMLYAVSAFYFHLVEGWSYLDAVYFTTSTISTVGYGDLVPKTDYGKIGSIALIFSGIGLAFYIFTHLRLLSEKKIDPHVKKRLELLRGFTMATTGMKPADLLRLKRKIKEREETR